VLVTLIGQLASANADTGDDQYEDYWIGTAKFKRRKVQASPAPIVTASTPSDRTEAPERWVVIVDSNRNTDSSESSPAHRARLVHPASGRVLVGKVVRNQQTGGTDIFLLDDIHNEFGERHQTDPFRVRRELNNISIQLDRKVLDNVIGANTFSRPSNITPTATEISFWGTNFSTVINNINAETTVDSTFVIKPKPLLDGVSAKLDTDTSNFVFPATPGQERNSNWREIVRIFQTDVLTSLRTTLNSTGVVDISNPERMQLAEEAVSKAVEGIQMAYNLGMRVQDIPKLVLDQSQEEETAIKRNLDSIPWQVTFNSSDDLVEALALAQGDPSQIDKHNEEARYVRERVKLANYDLTNQMVERAIALFLMAKPALGSHNQSSKLLAETYLMTKDAMIHGGHGSADRGTNAHQLELTGNAKATLNRSQMDKLIKEIISAINSDLFLRNEDNYTQRGWRTDSYHQRHKVVFSHKDGSEATLPVPVEGHYQGPHITRMIGNLLRNANGKLKCLQATAEESRKTEKVRSRLARAWSKGERGRSLVSATVQRASDWRQLVDWGSPLVWRHVNHHPQTIDPQIPGLKRTAHPNRSHTAHGRSPY